MLRTVTIVPAILTNDKVEYRRQIERINGFTKRAQNLQEREADISLLRAMNGTALTMHRLSLQSSLNISLIRTRPFPR